MDGVIKTVRRSKDIFLKNEMTNQVKILKEAKGEAKPIATEYIPLADNGQQTILKVASDHGTDPSDPCTSVFDRSSDHRG